MKVKFHWSDDRGVVVAPPATVDIVVLNGDGQPSSDKADLKLSVTTSGNGSQDVKWKSGTYAAAAHDVPRPGFRPSGLRFDLTKDDALIERGSFTLVSPAAAAWRVVAGVSLVLLVLGVLLFSTVLQQFWALLTTGVPVLLGALAFVKRVRDSVSRWLLNGWVSISVTLLAVTLLVVALCNIVRVSNLTPEPQTIGERTIQPKEVAFLLRDSALENAAERCVLPATGENRAAWRPSDVELGPTWVPWFTPLRQCGLVCDDPIPSALREQWQQSKSCKPTLEKTLKHCDAVATARAVFTTHKETKAAWRKEVDAKRNCWKGDEGFAQVKFGAATNLELVSQGTDVTRRVTYPRVEASKVLRLASSAGEFEFHTGGVKQGTVRFEGRGIPTWSCATFGNHGGVLALTLSGGDEEGDAQSSTFTERPYWIRDVPLCFRGTPDSAVLVFADGWVPQASGSVILPREYVPESLTLRTASGEWLGTVRVGASAPQRRTDRLTLSSHPTSWRSLAKYSSVAWNICANPSRRESQRTRRRHPKTSGSGSEGATDSAIVEVETPTQTSVGGIVWHVRAQDEKALELADCDLRSGAGRRSTGYVLSFDERRAKVQKKSAGPCYFGDGDLEYLGRSCPADFLPTSGGVDSAAATNAGVACSSLQLCKPGKPKGDER